MHTKRHTPNGDITSNPRRFDVGITSICWRPNFDEFRRHFHVLFRCNFIDWKIHVVSTFFFVLLNFTDRKIHVVSAYFYWRNLDGRKIHVSSTYFFDVTSMVKKSTLFPHTFFGVISLVEKYTLFPHTFFHVISLIEISTFFPRTFFDVILMVEKSTLFPRTFFEVISTGKNFCSTRCMDSLTLKRHYSFQIKIIKKPHTVLIFKLQ